MATVSIAVDLIVTSTDTTVVTSCWHLGYLHTGRSLRMAKILGIPSAESRNILPGGCVSEQWTPPMETHCERWVAHR